jgi:hypothetical protein
LRDFDSIEKTLMKECIIKRPFTSKSVEERYEDKLSAIH